ncbi:serine-aspartate repeat-containing protein F isoform X3 [Bactrocera dorsalis]|nr:serine-aspartate repeat-containing protein F isoform X3 [Bactrocera dorsalis]XP_049309195.1 serine-aspartate repeat-containing protein F isoform X3 [Bactrocera dorsalis]XP_049309196.1 serine-aspartate repeat-containing protein F isoform X3 [Bactrocera dorsalis]XP_049309197.1 serine-aspartate repeat-containing protein F isoform X3 [Bactrocera dorsalis]XP_049309198.1 serine-aspartate repeat-containing protein F isoform X3 [Bactrocera dorsalis]XP_049309199.1 serine-aspartate repeat-containing 
MEEDPDFELGEEKSIVLRVPKPAPPPKVKSAASIEARLREMQRKLSEIAEIPKILSSTLATVSQTFEKLNPSDLQQHRKHSYDEDALDYELSGANAEQRLKLKAKGKANAKTAEPFGGAKMYLAKDSTPESDYASEGNYESNEADTDDDYDIADGGDGDGGGDADDDDDENACEGRNIKERNGASKAAYFEHVESGTSNYNSRARDPVKNKAGSEAEAAIPYAFLTRMRPAKSSLPQRKQYKQQHHHDNVNDSANVVVSDKDYDDITTTDDEAQDYADDDDNEDSDEDVVTARLVSDDSGSEVETEVADVAGNGDDDDDDAIDDDEATDDDEDFLTATYTWNLNKIPKLQLNDEKQSGDESNSYKDQIDMDDTDEEKPKKKARWCHADDDLQKEKHLQWVDEEDEKEKKFADKLERSWPWADREKIIYKQSTCHLVRRRPLGLVEQRIKLLAKQNLSDSLERQLQ